MGDTTMGLVVCFGRSVQITTHALALALSPPRPAAL